LATALTQGGSRRATSGTLTRQIKGKKATSETAAYRCCELSDKTAALAGLERWKNKHTEIAGFLATDDVLVDSMRGSSSTWTRIRVNLRHVPEAQRPLQETPEPDDDPTREWRHWRKKKAAKNDG
jgi:bifunctional non-homologous end joining protein LigD